MLRHFVFLLLLLAACGQANRQSRPSTNHLKGQTSPYLLQHLYNPVDWYPWCETALQKAQAENKLLIVSIGYSACHWCHVMEEESFSDTSIARLMNGSFINIKVDREERPDLDHFFMDACLLAGQGNCGWPLNVIALPDGSPIWTGTYYPPERWKSLLEYFRDSWKKEPENVQDFGNRMQAALEKKNQPRAGDLPTGLSPKEVNAKIREFHNGLDKQFGGQQGAPKFPLPNNRELLLCQAYYEKDTSAIQQLETCLDAMVRGGIFDQLGGGFSRYTVDGRWRFPHFEKMLYDNAQLISLYARAFRYTKKEAYATTVRETLGFVLRELSDKEGAFFSSFDADSEGKEGHYYSWSMEEIQQHIKDPLQLEIVKGRFGLKTKGNWEEGRNLLWVEKTIEELAAQTGFPDSRVRDELESARDQLFLARQKRTPPGRDEKVITAWNALMLTALCEAFEAFGEDSLRQRALLSGNYLMEHAFRKDTLFRMTGHGPARIPAFLDDHAFLTEAFIALYRVTLDEKWLLRAATITERVLKEFSLPSSPLFSYTPGGTEGSKFQTLNREDNVLPSGNSVMAKCLEKLGHYFFREEWIRRSAAMYGAIGPDIRESPYPSYYANWLSGMLPRQHQTYEVAVAGPEADRIREELAARFLPDVLLMGATREGKLPLLKGKMDGENTRIFVCVDRVCRLPVTKVDQALEQMGKTTGTSGVAGQD